MERLPHFYVAHSYRAHLKSNRVCALIKAWSEAGGRKQVARHRKSLQAGEQWLGSLLTAWNLGKIITTCSSGQRVKSTGAYTQVCSLLRHLSSLQNKHHSQTIPRVPPSCLNHVLIHPLSQSGCMFGLSPKSRKTQLLALI